MEYYKLLQLDREPFSNSPDPDYFFQSHQHLGCLQKLELALRLKRGLNVVIGDVGTGKTTLCRHLIRKFSTETDFECHLVLDPSFDTQEEFLNLLFEFFCGHVPDSNFKVSELKESIKQSLFIKGVDEQKTVVLIIDEGQKATEACIEIMRELLNYETNTFKLLQIVIFAQLEFEQILKNRSNFADRINVLHYLAPMNFKDTRLMVHHRLKLSSKAPKPRKLFTLPAMWAIYRASRGYPRKIIHLCHQSMLAVIIQNRSQVGWSIIRSCKKRFATPRFFKRGTFIAGLSILAVALILIGLAPNFFSQAFHSTPALTFKINPPDMNNQAVAQDLPDAVSPMENEKSSEGQPGAPTVMTKAKINVQIAEKSLTDNASGTQVLEDVPSSADSVALEPPEPDAPPSFLGQITVRPGDTLADLALLVYGTYGNGHLQALVKANRHIDNPDAIEIGDIIRFPSRPLYLQTKPVPSYWIVLDELDSLPSAAQRFSDMSAITPLPLHIIPNWNSESGLRFFLTVKGIFRKEEEALSYIKELPEEMTATCRVASGWEENTLFYADPYSGGIMKSTIIP